MTAEQELKKIESAVASRFEELDKNGPDYVYEVQRVRAFEQIENEFIMFEDPNYPLKTGAIEATAASRGVSIILQNQQRTLEQIKFLEARIRKQSIQLTIMSIVFFVLLIFILNQV